MNELDLNMRLLKNKPILINNVGFLHQLTLDEIEEINDTDGWLKFYQYLHLLCINNEEIQNLLNNTEVNINTFEYLVLMALQSEELLNISINGLSLFFKEEVFFDYDDFCFYLGDKFDKRIINYNNYEEIKYILAKQSCISCASEFNPVNEKAKEMAERIKEMRKKYAKCEKQTDTENDLSDIVSSVCAKHHSINFFNVGNLTLFQLIDQFKRLNAIDQYFIDIESIRNGASKDEVKLKHWSLKLDR